MGRRHLATGVGVLAFAFLALVNGFDRMSEQRPSFGRFVPQTFAATSSRRAAADFLLEPDVQAARGAAAAAITKDPLEARSLGFLGTALLQSGQVLPAHRAFLQAAKLSKREPLSQLYFFEQELSVGSYARAAARLDAFLRSVANRDVAQVMLAMFEERAGNGAYLTQRLADSPRWADAYLRAEGADPERLRKRATFLARSDVSLDAIGCDAVLPMIRELGRLNFRTEADSVTRRHCPGRAPEGDIADAEFEAFGDDTAPLGWRRYRSGDVRVTRLAGDEARIELENRSSVTRLVLSQPVSLAPGSYVIRAKVDGPGGQDLVASLNCTTPSRPRAQRQRIDRDGQTLTAVTCADAVLGLWLRPGSGRVVVDRIELSPLNP
ncbi:hypothetical protein [Qipengyuania soli]|uniref:Tetratricopeptide repeat protein n=1 Tax=Qipengyuania soli TaxID=2782568 RepID=A0A7S8IUR2_9SPHN|nr:hypothetical protein [Qipengyuania soli]QPC98026.1 hypothetical protein IRL76_09005 [Qipengyuania soli]